MAIKIYDKRGQTNRCLMIENNIFVEKNGVSRCVGIVNNFLIGKGNMSNKFVCWNVSLLLLMTFKTLFTFCLFHGLMLENCDMHVGKYNHLIAGIRK